MFLNLVPSKIDRGDELNLLLAKITHGEGVFIERYSEDWKDKRMVFMHELGINYASQFIPIMIQSISEFKDSLKVGDQIDFTEASKKISFSIISKILFGTDIDSLIEDLDYINRDGTTSKLALDVFFSTVIRSLTENYINPITAFFPFLNRYSLCKPFSTDVKNIDTFRNSIKEFFKRTKDETSLYSR